MTSKRVLAAEDSPTQAAVLRAHLEDAGFDVSLASNGAEALDLMEQHAHDLVVSDVVMPDVDGYELCRRVKERHPSVPVVLLTSMTDPLDVVNALSAGADNFLRKPYEPAELIHRIGNMLHNKQLREAGRTQMGLELYFLGRRFMINSDREQILDLLVSTFEELVTVNQRLTSREEELAAARDELSRRLAETERERDRLHAVLAAVPGGMAVFGRDGRIIHANQRLADLCALPLSQLNGANAWDVIRFVDHEGSPLEDEQRALSETLCEGRGAVRGTAFDLMVQRPDGERVPVVARTEPMLRRDGEVIGAVGTMEDLRTVMHHDPVTGMPGHAVLVERVNTVSDLMAEHGTDTGVVVVVVDRYERFHHRLPADDRDRLIATVATRMREALDSPDVEQRSASASAAYLGNGEFAVVLPDLHGEHDAVTVGQLLVDRLGGRLDTDGLELALTVSAAVGMCSDKCDATTLVATVAAAARQTSHDGGGRVATSDAHHQEQVIEGLRREAELRAALEGGELTVHYQPEVALRGEEPVALEALVRWDHPTRGVVGASEVVPLAVDSGLISALGWFVLESACRQGAAWQRELGDRAPALSVNLAAEQLADREAAQRIDDILSSTGFDPTMLVLEITEGSVMHDADLARVRLAQIKALGCRIAIDDFGTGYSSLLQLRRLPVDVLKIDRTFVQGMLEHPADAAIVTTVVRLARALGLEVVAEGVETEDHLVQLRALGCDLGQGFLWARPMPATEAERWWTTRAPTGRVTSSATEGLAQSDEAQDEVISYLVHELRSPLAAISGFADLLRSSAEGESAEFVSAIVRNARELEDRLGSLREVDDLLRGGLTLRREDRDVADLVGTLVHDMAAQLQPHPVAFEASGRAVASVDRARLLQAVSNLVTNAAKFSPPDEPIDVAVRDDGSTITVEVRDRGPGVPPERRPELFRRFSRLGSTATGMGLGLYLARLVVEAHGGVIRYQDAPGGGALFSIRLPSRSVRPRSVTSAAGLALGGRSRPNEEADAPGGGATVLCVEDDASTARLLQRVLAAHEVHVVAEGAAALDRAADVRPDVVLLDRHVGDVSGDDVLRRLRAHDELAGVPVIILTASADDRLAERLRSTGATAVLTKPFHPAQLRATLSSILRAAAGSPPPPSEGRPPPPPSPSKDPLDPGLVSAIAALDGDDELHAVVARGIDDARTQLELLRRAVDAADADAIAGHAHAICGALGNFGATTVIHRCRHLEQVAGSHDRDLLRQALHDVDAAVEHAAAALVHRFPPGR